MAIDRGPADLEEAPAARQEAGSPQGGEAPAAVDIRAAAGARDVLAPPPRPGRGLGARRAAAMLGLQQTVGNQAVQRLLRRPAPGPALTPGPAPRPAPHSRPIVVQRAITHDVPPTNPDAAVPQYILDFDKAVQRADMYVLHVPELGAYKDLDGYTERWVELWQESKSGNPSGQMAMAFGYAVETLATIVYLPSAPSGMAIELQGPRGDTRPDVILKRGAADVAWLDITSAGSPGHIWLKAGWDTATVHVAELTYPAMNLAHFNPTPDYKDDVDQGEFRKRIHWANELLKIRREAWRALGAYFKPNKIPREDPTLREARLRGEICARLGTYFQVASVDEPTAASVLYAMGVSPKTHGLNLRTSRARGESFLLQHDPNLPTIEIPEDGVPRPVPITEEYRAFLIQAQQQGALDPGVDPDLTAEPPQDPSVASEVGQGVGPQMEQNVGQEGALVTQSGVQSLALQPVASYEAQLDALPPMSPVMFTALNEYLQQNQLALAFTLTYGSFQMNLFAMPGADFAEQFREAMANLPPPEMPANVGHALEYGEGEEDQRHRPRPFVRRAQYRIHARFLRYPSNTLGDRQERRRLQSAAEREAPLPTLPPFLALLFNPSNQNTADTNRL